MRAGAVIERRWEEDFPLSPELRVLLACARTVVDGSRVDEFRLALAACPDAGRLVEEAVAQVMLGHLHRMATVEPETAGPVLGDRLAGLQRASAHRCLRQTGHLLRLLESLRAAGVDAMPYKGPAWAARLYGDVTLRSWVDLDILMAYEQVAAARDVLLAGGYVDGSPYAQEILRRKRGGWGEIPLTAPASDVHVELHWEITAGFSGRSLRPEAVFGRAGKLRLLEREVTTPCSADCLVMSCINGAKDRWNTVEALLGLATQVSVISSQECLQALDIAREAGCLRRVVASLAHVCGVFDMAVPAAVTEALDRDRTARSLVRSLDPGSLAPGSSGGPRRELTAKFWRFATEDSEAAAIWHGAVRFFLPGPEDWAWLSLPAWAGWLYYVLRPFRLAVKWTKRL